MLPNPQRALGWLSEHVAFAGVDAIRRQTALQTMCGIGFVAVHEADRCQTAARARRQAAQTGISILT